MSRPKFDRCRRAGLTPTLAKFMAGPMEWGWQPSVRAIEIEAYLEAQQAKALAILNEATALIESGQPIPPEMLQRARELFGK